MSKPALPDATARRRAAHDFDANLVVVAGAGTGKTSLLVERALSALGRGLVGIGDLAAITFTEKAAGEMRVRLADGLERLRALARGEASPEGEREAERAYRVLVETERLDATEVAARALSALQVLDRARITTIHAFCADLLREHPVEAGLAPDFIVDEGEHARALLETSWARFFAAELQEDGERAASWRELLGVLPAAQVRAAAHLLSGFAVPLPVPGEAPPVDVDELFAPVLRRLEETLADIQERQRGLSPKPTSYLEEMLAAVRAARAEGTGVLADRVKRSEALSRDKIPDANKRLTGVSERELTGAFGVAKELIRGLAALDEPRFVRLLDLLAPFARGFRESMLRAGFVSFDGLLALARDLLRDHPAVRDKVKRRYRMLLLDEFQDTDPCQYEIVLFLAEATGGDARDPYRAELTPGRLFVVGDPKQSIYRFRGADYSAFVRAIDRIAPEGEGRLHLVANFRSRPEVVEPVNRLLSAAGGAWQASAYQPPYEPIAAARPAAADGPRVELWTIDAGADPGAEARREAEGRVLAAAIRRMVEAGECGYRDVTVLLRAFTKLPLYLRPLRAAGIPFVVDGGRELLERTEVVQLVAVLRALVRRSDTVALLAYLRSPAAGVADEELAAYAGGAGSWDWGNRVDPARFPRIARAFELLRRIDEAGATMPADAAIRHALAETLLVPLAAFGYEGAQRVANLRKVAAAAAALAREGKLTPNEILDSLERERLPDLEGESPLADETWESVRILTIHKAKGLENRVVFIPDLAREEVRGGFRPEVEIAAVRPPGPEPLVAIRTGDARNAASLWHQVESKRHDEAEEVRTLYVALTRARERLILFGGTSRGRAPWVEALGAWGYDPEAPPGDGEVLGAGVLHRRATPGPRTSAARSASPPPPRGMVGRWEEAAGILRAAGAPFARPSGLHEEEETRRERADEGVRRRAGRERARAVGRLVHRALELWDGRDEAALRRAVALHAGAIAGEDRLDPDAIAAEAAEVVESFLRSPLASRLRAAEVLGRELPLLLHEPPDRTWRGSIDLLYRDPEGRIVVADYKTDPDPAGAADRHGDQLRLYAEAVRRALRLESPPRAELWMVRTGDLVPVDASDAPSSPDKAPGPDAEDPRPLFRNL